MAIHSELFVETRPISDVRVRSAAYGIWYTIMRRYKEPGAILVMSQEEWEAAYEPLCDPNKFEDEAECERLRKFLKAMPELVRNGGITVNWAKKPNGAMKYHTDEWGTVTRFHNPSANTTDPQKPKKYRSPVRQEPDAPKEDWWLEYWSEFEAAIMFGDIKERDVKNLLHKERKEARAAKKSRHASTLPVRHATEAESGPQNIHLRHTPKPAQRVLTVGTIVRPVTMLALAGGASVDTDDWGEIQLVSLHEYRVTFATHSYIDVAELDMFRGEEITATVRFQDVVEI
jgi:hypothetical protein